MYLTGGATWGAPTDAAVLGVGNLRVSARTPPELREKQCFLQASRADRRGPVGDVRLARAAFSIECIECIAAAFCRSDRPLAARRITSAQDRGARGRRLVRATRKIPYFLVLPGGASAGCRGPPLSGGNPAAGRRFRAETLKGVRPETLKTLLAACQTDKTLL